MKYLFVLLLLVPGCGPGGISAAIMAAKPTVDVFCTGCRHVCDVVSPTAGGANTTEPGNP